MRTNDAVEQWVSGRLARAEIMAPTAMVQRERLRTLAMTEARVERIDRAALLRWQESVAHFATETRRSYQSTVWCFCRWLVVEGVLSADPTVGLARVRQPISVPRALRRSDVYRVLAICPDERARAMVWLMVGCGLRRVEVARLELHDYDDSVATMLVVGKGGHERVLPLPSQVTAALAEYIVGRGYRAGALFLPAKGCSRWSTDGHLSPAQVGKIVGKAMTAAGVHRQPYDGRTAHALRHTAASDVLDRCGNVRTVQQMLGHRSLQATQRYLRRASLGQLREAMEGRAYDSAS